MTGKRQDTKELEDDLGKYKAIASAIETEGGKILLDSLRQDIATDVERLAGLLNGTMTEMQAAIAKLKVDLSFYRVLKRANNNVILAEEALQKLLEEGD
jgi:hypothetical protein